MECPKCHAKFETITFNTIEIDRCTNCRGLWFDMLEKDDLVKLEGSESIDIGSDELGREYDDMREIDCPHCQQSMIPMIDKDQFHIRFESCPSCYGVFFDAGEFRDLKENTVMERFSKMLQTLRTNL